LGNGKVRRTRRAPARGRPLTAFRESSLSGPLGMAQPNQAVATGVSHIFRQKSTIESWIAKFPATSTGSERSAEGRCPANWTSYGGFLLGCYSTPRMATPRNPGGRATVPGRATHQQWLEGAILALSETKGAGGGRQVMGRRSSETVGFCPAANARPCSGPAAADAGIA